MAQQRALLALLCAALLCGAARGANEADTVCTLSLRGSAADNSAVASASLRCTGVANLTVYVGPELQPFSAAFTGVTVVSYNTSSTLGALLRVDNAALTLTDSVVEQLSAPLLVAPLAFQASNVTITGSRFAGCVGGGAGVISASAAARVRILNSSFEGNSGGAGAVAVDGACASAAGRLAGGAGCVLEVSDSSFAGNAASGSGGALQLQLAGFDVLLARSAFTNNSAPGGGGGAVALFKNGGTAAALNVTGCTFAANGAASGGALYASSPLLALGGGTSFARNSAVNGSGGAVFMDHTCGASILSAMAGGPQSDLGAFACVAALADTSFVGNNATGGSGGAVFLALDGFRITAGRLNFTDNVADIDAGALGVDRTVGTQLGAGFGSLLVLGGCAFGNNSAGQGGGALALRNLQCLALLGSSVANSSAAASGGALFLRGLTGDPASCAVSANVSDVAALLEPGEAPLFTPFAGSPRAGGARALDFRRMVFQDNQAGTSGSVGYGGAMIATELSQPAGLVNCTFSGNSAPVYGGGAVLNGVEAVTMDGCAFYNNSAGSQGGGVYYASCVDSALALQMFACNFTANRASLYGGAVYGGNGATLEIGYGTQMTRNNAVTGGGAVACRDCSLVLVNGSRLADNTCDTDGGAIKCLDCISMFIDRAAFVNNSGSAGGALSVESTAPYGQMLLTLNNSLFANNSALSPAPGGSFVQLQGAGGAIRMFGSVLLADNTTFDGNAAATAGGALLFNQSCLPPNSTYLWSQGQPALKPYADKAANCSYLSISNSTIVNNRAVFAGGAFFVTSPQVVEFFCDSPNKNITGFPGLAGPCDDWRAGNNSVGPAGYGPVMAHPPRRLAPRCGRNAADVPYTCALTPARGANASGLLALQNAWSTTDLDAATGRPLAALVLDVDVLDDMDQPVTTGLPGAVAVTVQAQAPANYSSILYGQLSTTARQGGTAAFTDLLLRAVPGVYNVSLVAPGFERVNASTVMVQVRRCNTGEVVGAAGDVCSRCPALQYSFDPRAVACNAPCPANAECGGGAGLVPLAGFWHSAANATLVHACPNPDACRGNRTVLQQCQEAWYGSAYQPGEQAQLPCRLWNVEDEDAASYMFRQCSPGYRGVLCGKCASGYGQTGRFRCARCSSITAVVFQYLVASLGALAFILYDIVRTIKDAAGEWNKPKGSDAMQIVTLYLQLVTIVGILDIKWPVSIRTLFNAVGWVTNTSSSQLVSLDCLINQEGSDALAVARTFARLAIPGFVLLLIVVGWVLWFVHHRRQGSAVTWGELRHRLSVSTYIVLGFFYPSLAQATLTIFSCYPADAPAPSDTTYPQNLLATWTRGYWIADMQQRCYYGRHLALALGLGIPTLILVCLGVPFLTAGRLAANRRRLDTDDFRARFGFLYRRFRPRLWWWGAASQCGLLALLLVAVNGRQAGLYLQALALLSCLTAITLILLLLHPLRFAHLQRLQNAAFVVVLYTLVGSLFFLDYEHQAAQGGLDAIAVLLLAVNGGLIAWLVYSVAAFNWPEVVSKAATVRKLLVSGTDHFQRWRSAAPGTLRAAASGLPHRGHMGSGAGDALASGDGNGGGSGPGRRPTAVGLASWAEGAQYEVQPQDVVKAAASPPRGGSGEGADGPVKPSAIHLSDV